MAGSSDLIDFDVIEGQKENIQSLPGGRSAKKLAQIYSPSTSTPLQKLATPTPSDTKNVNDCIRAEYEAEVQNISESDDPLDVFDRYVRWTLDAYPSAQATPQSQLHTLLERATKHFIGSAQYKDDPRYLKLWLLYIQFFTDSPRETFIYMSRHGVGESLALFYEEYAAWLEGAARWSQAEEVYKTGIEREARPVQRLQRKFKEFEERQAQQAGEDNQPSSPALPTMRPALAAKTDPFGLVSEPADPQARRANSGGNGTTKPAKSKMAIFSDNDSQPSALGSNNSSSKGWDTIGTMADRKKENKVEAKPWVGETLKAGGKKPAASAAKMAIFRDASLSQINNIVVVPSQNQVTIHPQTGKKERIFVDLSALYPTPDEQGTELGFEEVMAANRGWLDCTWEEEPVDLNLIPETAEALPEVEEISRGVSNRLVIHHDRVPLDENGAPMMDRPKQPRGAKKKKKVMEVNETQVIKAKLDSPSGPKMRKKNTSEPTMTLHTKAATDDIYDIFNAPMQPLKQEDEESQPDDDDYETDGDYTTDAESTGTTRQVDGTSEVGDDDNDYDSKSVSEWSDFEAKKHVPQLDDQENEYHQDDTQVSRYSEHDEQYEDEADEDQYSPTTRTVFVPVQPEDYDPPTRPFRDPVEMANNRLPFMTPITERTEVSLEVLTERRIDQFKTPSKRDANMVYRDEDPSTSDLEAMSSPLRSIESSEPLMPKVPLALAPKAAVPLAKASAKKPLASRGPIIKDVQCNPVEENIRNEILANSSPPLNAYPGFHDHRHEKSEYGHEIRRYAKAITKMQKAGGDRTSLPATVVIDLPNAVGAYTVKRELGAGAYAPVYLVENSDPEEAEQDENAIATMGKGAFAVNHRSELEALKMEIPPTPWEFHMMRVAHTRLGPQHRAAASLSYAHELHLYQDEAFLLLPYHPHGTLLDVVNLFRAEPSGVMDEQLAMFFTIELLRTVEALHTKSVLHGDLKPDNCLLRLDNLSHDRLRQQEPLSSQWRADGSGGWESRGVVLIDFGRAIDMRNFVPEVGFIADWQTTSQDCAEMREGRPWTWQIDYHGLAGTIHCLLFGKYIETVRCDQGGLTRGGRRYRIREALKRYWQTDLWNDCFEVLLNPNSFADAEEGMKMPVLRSLGNIRERMETWLEGNCERGVGLKSMLGKIEGFARSRNRRS